MLLPFFLIIGLVFGGLAGACAFLITWNEYQKHQFTTARLIRESSQTALFVFGFFLILSVLIGWVL